MHVSQPASSTLIGRAGSALIYLLALIIGLHLHRVFILLYIMVALILWKGWEEARHQLRPWWPLLVLSGLFSLSYAAGMLRWHQWLWPADMNTVIDMLVLPTLLLAGGIVAGGRGWRLPAGILLSYSLGALIFALLTLAVNRHPWWDLSQAFGGMVKIPWGEGPAVNVRSIEQNALPAVVLLPISVTAILKPGVSGRIRTAAWLGLVLGLLGIHSVLSFEGRLGMLVLLLAALPWLAEHLGQWAKQRRRRPWLMAALGTGAVTAVAAVQRLGIGPGATVGWGQGLCDERLSLHLAILRHLGSAPWGGRQLEVPYQLCDGSTARLAPEGGTVSLAHNVVLDVVRDVGVLPALLLIGLLLPLVFCILHGLLTAWQQQRWSWMDGFWWGWLMLLGCQWSFQPLQHSDVLLYVLTFFALAAMAAGLPRGLLARDEWS